MSDDRAESTDVAAALPEWRTEAAADPVRREVLLPDGRLLNFHARVVGRPLREVYGRIRALGSPRDDLWPVPSVPMRNESSLGVGTCSGHGRSRYICTAVDELARVEWRFTMRDMHGRHGYSTCAIGDATYVEHLIDGRVEGAMAAYWPTAIGPFHDWIIERILDRLAAPPVPWIEGRIAELLA